ncbi:MAG: EpsG family protein [Clostridia bacterium]|nr:EpsG family protein [Clostridia bacterium]
MIPYMLITAGPVALSLLYRNINNDNRKKRSFLIFCGLALFLFMGLRSRFLGSGDTQGYFGMMKSAIASGSWSEYYDEDGVEVGFQFFTYILSRLFDDAQALIIVTAAIYSFSICHFIYYNSKDVAFSTVAYITLGLMTFEMQGMRQSIAMSICLLSYELVKRKKFVPFVLAVLFAMLFHRTAIVFLVVYFISKLSYNWKNIAIMVVASAVVMFFADDLVAYANEIFDSSYVNGFESGGVVATAIYFLIIIFAIIFHKELGKDKNEATMFYVLMIGAVCYVMRYIGTTVAERISFYFAFAQLTVLPNSLEYLKPREKKAIKVIVYVLMAGLFAYRLVTSADFLPYEFYWND